LKSQNLQSISDPLGHQTSFTYDPQGQPQTITTPAGTTQLGHTLGDLTTITDPLNNVTTRFTVTQTTFDPINRPKVITWADSSTTTLTWDAGNRLTQVVDSISGTITRSWDDLDRLSYEQASAIHSTR